MKLKVTRVNDNLVHVRNGEVVLYKRGDSAKWQARYKLKDLKWRRVATKHANIQYAAEVACEAYDRARFLYDEKIPVSSKRFDVAANLAVDEMRKQISAGVGKSVYNDYITAINKYLIPFFGKYNINSIGYEELQAFGTYREAEMGRKPVASTVTTHISAMNRVYDVAIERGWIAQQQVPKIKNTGAKGTAREAFSKSEYSSLTSYMVKWSENGLTDRATQIRTLLRDYVLILANTGMRHGTEALGLKWNDIAYITIKNQKFLQLTVTGKRGRRTLIANHNAEIYLERIAKRQPHLQKYSLDTLLRRKVNEPVFKTADGEESKYLASTFRQLMKDSGLDKDRATKLKRTLYSLRHTYAHEALLTDKMDVYTLAKQMGTSVKMIEMHYGHLNPTLKAEVIAGKRHTKKIKEEVKIEEEKETKLTLVRGSK